MATRCTTTSNRFRESYRCPAWRISDASSSKPKGATPDLSRRHWSTPTSYGQESEGMPMTGGISWITTRWNGDKGRPSWDGRTASSARPMKGQWAMRSYIHSWEAAKSPMSIRSNGWNVHLTTYTPASQRTNSQSYCLVTSFETRRVSDGYLRWIQSNHPKRGRAKMAHPLFAIAYNAFLLFIRLWIHWLRPRLQELSLQKRVLPWLLLRRPREQLLPP